MTPVNGPPPTTYPDQLPDWATGVVVVPDATVIESEEVAVFEVGVVESVTCTVKV